MRQQEAPPEETGAEEKAQVVDQSTESVSRYAGVYKARRDMRKALNLTLPGGTDLVRTKVKLTYVLTLREDGSFDLETEDGDEAFLAAKREATIEIVRSIQAGKLKEAGYSEEQFDEVAGISGFEDFASTQSDIFLSVPGIEIIGCKELVVEVDWVDVDAGRNLGTTDVIDG